jgi:hypothetical protein
LGNLNVSPHFGDVIAYIEEARASDPESDRLDRDQLAKYGAITVNELRAASHLEPIDGGDTLIKPGSGGITVTPSGGGG